jgi:hypothetical protein
VLVHNANYANANPASRQQGEQFRARAQEWWDMLPDGRRYGSSE